MIDWHEVHDSRTERPLELEDTTSAATVYERRNIRQETRSDPMTEGEIKEWVYEQREYTREEYAQTRAPAIREILDSLSGLGKAVEDLGKASSTDAAELAAAIERGLTL